MVCVRILGSFHPHYWLFIPLGWIFFKIGLWLDITSTWLPDLLQRILYMLEAYTFSRWEATLIGLLEKEVDNLYLVRRKTLDQKDILSNCETWL